MNRLGAALFLIIFSALIAVLNSCSIETAKPSKNKELIILSDYLEMSDTTFFKQFIVKENLSFEIINMEADKIIGLMRNQENNVQADLILVKSLFDVYRMQKRGILQQIHFEEELHPSIKKISSSEFNFVGFGLDPYIIANSDGVKARTYNDLLRIKYLNLLPKRELIPMLAPVSSKLKKVKANRWIKDFSKNAVIKGDFTDSTSSKLPILTTYREYETNKDTLYNFENRFLTYPNARSNGSFYNIYSISIVKQAQSYSLAKKFILFYTSEKNNLQLNKKNHTISILGEISQFRKYKESSEKLMHYYQTVERVLQKVD